MWETTVLLIEYTPLPFKTFTKKNIYQKKKTDFTNVQLIALNTFSFPNDVIYEHYNKQTNRLFFRKDLSPNRYADFSAAVQDITLHWLPTIPQPQP